MSNPKPNRKGREMISLPNPPKNQCASRPLEKDPEVFAHAAPMVFSIKFSQSKGSFYFKFVTVPTELKKILRFLISKISILIIKYDFFHNTV